MYIKGGFIINKVCIDTGYTEMAVCVCVNEWENERTKK